MKKYTFTLPLLLAIVYFFTAKDVLPAYIYIIISAPVALFFFPGRLFLIHQPESDKTSKYSFLASNLIFFLITVGSILWLFIGSNKPFRTAFLILSLLNFLAALYYASYRSKSEESIIHICFIALATAVHSF